MKEPKADSPEWRAWARHEFDQEIDRRIELDKELAELRRKLATTVEALKEIAKNDCKYCDCQENSKQIADEALAKCIKK